MLIFRRSWVFLAPTLCCLLLAACSMEVTSSPVATRTPGVTLTPFTPQPAGPTATASPPPIRSPTPPPSPTATPFLYEIVASDTLIGIAFRFGITLEDLLAANPGVDPQFLTIGETLVIPLADNPAAAAALPTPVGEVVLTGRTECWPVNDGSLWCFALYENRGAGPVDNLAASISVYAADGTLLETRTAIAPVNQLPAGSKTALLAWFPGLGAAYRAAEATLISALPVSDGDDRYVPVDLDYEIVLEGETALVVGDVLPAADLPFTQARIAAIAFDRFGRVIGVRVLETPVPDPAGGTAGFRLEIFSLGGRIEEVLVLGEGYP